MACEMSCGMKNYTQYSVNKRLFLIKIIKGGISCGMKNELGSTRPSQALGHMEPEVQENLQ